MNTKEIELILNGKSTKSTAGQAWSVTKFITGALWCSTKFVAKNTPAAIGMAWEVKKEISNSIAKEIEQTKKEQQQLELDNKIAQLKPPKTQDKKHLSLAARLQSGGRYNGSKI